MLKKVLCVDDDSITLMICSNILKKSTFAEEIDSALNGQEAIDYYEKLLQNPQSIFPALIFLDINMPVMNGWDFLQYFTQHLQAQLPETKVIMLSSTVNPDDFERAKYYKNVVDFLRKPLTHQNLEQLKTHETLTKFFVG